MNGENTGKSEGFDASKFRDEIKAEHQELLNNAINTMNQNLQATLNGFKAGNKTEAQTEDIFDASLEKYKQEIDEIGVDGKQAQGLVKMFKKIVEELKPGLRDEVLTTVDSNLSLKEQKAEYTRRAMMQYPDVSNKKSTLWQEMTKVWTEMSDVARKAPDAELIAAERAALRLGIKPLTASDINAFGAGNPTGGGAGTTKIKPLEIPDDIASLFNVDAKKLNEKLRLVKKSA